MITPSYSLTATERVAPKLALDFTTGTLDPRITFTRSTTATYYNSAGVLSTAAIDAPRFDYNPSTLTSLGLLIEEQRTNVLTYSEQLDAGAVWVKQNTTVTVNATVAPDGTSSADKVVETTATAAHIIYQNYTVPSGAFYSFSFFAKAGERNVIRCQIFQSSVVAVADVNLSTGTLSGVTAGSASIIGVGNGWYRVTITGNASAASTILRTYPLVGGTASYTGDGVSGYYLWGAQLEVGAFSTSYIPTVASATTRGADVAVMTGANFSNWYNASQGMFRVNASTPASGTRALISADDNTSGNSIVMSTVGTAPSLVVTQSSAEQANVTAGTITANTAMFAYASYGSDYFGIARPSTRQVDTSGTVPTVDRLRIGADQAGNYANGIIQAVQFWP